MTQHPTAPHDPRTCRPCAPFRHPSTRGVSKQLTAALPATRKPMDDEVGK